MEALPYISFQGNSSKVSLKLKQNDGICLNQIIQFNSKILQTPSPEFSNISIYSNLKEYDNLILSFYSIILENWFLRFSKKFLSLREIVPINLGFKRCEISENPGSFFKVVSLKYLGNNTPAYKITVNEIVCVNA